ncbi:MAG: sigma-70 family RNA polymerase sigma factor [Oscillospiraceae bacterium]|nr:sigma-70 family RNA polymerase sigma factor [Oscillospiraceae bacterium]
MTEEQFKELVNRYERLVYTICYQMVRDSQLAEDLAQETFLSAYLHINSCPSGAEKPWLARIATNKAKDYLKSAYNRKVALAQTDDSETLTAHDALYSAPAPEDIYISQESIAYVREQIMALKEPYLKVSVLFFLEDKTVDEISQMFQRPSKTVHTQLYRAKSMLKLSLKEV